MPANEIYKRLRRRSLCTQSSHTTWKRIVLFCLEFYVWPIHVKRKKKKDVTLLIFSTLSTLERRYIIPIIELPLRCDVERCLRSFSYSPLLILFPLFFLLPFVPSPFTRLFFHPMHTLAWKKHSHPPVEWLQKDINGEEY